MGAQRNIKATQARHLVVEQQQIDSETSTWVDKEKHTQLACAPILIEGELVRVFWMQSMLPHILIVESDFAAARVTSAILARAVPTAIVSVESDFEAARRSMQSHPPDVLIVDPVRHRPESIWLIQHLKTKHPDAHVIVIASAPTPALRREMEGLGVDAYLEKPELLSLQIQQVLAVLRPAPPAHPAAAIMKIRGEASAARGGGPK